MTELTTADTAYATAYARARESEKPEGERLFSDPYAAIFEAAGAHAREGIERFKALPFFVDLVAIRTRAIDDVVRTALDAGVRQVVLMGAGFDARAWRMPEITRAGARVFEVDFEAQLAKKRALLSVANVTLPGHASHVACDFAAPDFERTLQRGLSSKGFRERAGSVFVWEGVIAYIASEAIDRSLAAMAKLGGPNSRVVFDFAPIALDPPAETRIQNAGFTRFEAEPYARIWKRVWKTPPAAAADVPHIGTAFT